ncbi:putative ABC transport system permease protein [Chryseolinea serpens]|uniref:Putative ABC transport system permease protein n=1 Tax=Chryseolinea serpens TaxID=947013 RepID=A0A1M5VU78_9BACT|nr:ABC transporter permease [Chryseolinea serpens]SHH78730.1 putative ABC transport system permease protein [Chryseolinea serpens]
MQLRALALRFLKGFCPPHLHEAIEGDLLQRYEKDLMAFGERKASQRLMWNVLRFFRPGILLRNKLHRHPHHNLMLRTNARVIARQWGRSKAFSFVNLTGLTLGVTVCLLVTQFVLFENSFEDINKQADRTYRVNLYNTENGVFDEITPNTVAGLGYALKQTAPGVESVARIGYKTRGVVTHKARLVEDREEIVFADPSIVDVLGLYMAAGDKAKMLRDANTILISESAALKYFGRPDVMGETLEVGFNNNSAAYAIGGVFKDIPVNAHQHFQFVLPPKDEQAWNGDWDWSEVNTYVVLSPGVQPQDLTFALSRIVQEHHHDNTGDRYLLEPIRDIRLHALDGSGHSAVVRFFILLASVILLLAGFNYINLSTARFFERMKAVGIRKLMGATRRQLVFQFLMESFFFNVLSFGFAVILFFVAWPLVTNVLQEPIPVTLFHEPWVLGLIPGFILVTSLCAGFYPALVLSSFKPLSSLQGKIASYADRAALRKILVTVQLSVSMILITAVVAIQQQIGFMQGQHLGIAIDQTLIVEEPLLTDATTVQKFETFQHDLQLLPGVQGVTYASTFAGTEIDWHRMDITVGQENATPRYDSRIVAVGTEFLEVFQLPLLEGRNFDAASENDRKAMLISEAACRRFGFSTNAAALGKLIFVGSRQFEVIGVVKDYHYRSLQTSIEPLLYMEGYPRNPRYAIKIAPENISQTLTAIESKWKEAYAGNVFKYYFLDEFFNRQYNADQKLGTLVSALSLLAAFISCTGLFGLTLYSVNRKVKEIGIRKVFGASVSDVVIFLTRDLLRLIALGGALGMPLVCYGVKAWLEGYAYKMPLGILMFAGPVMIIAALALITTGALTVAAARRSPVDAMKCE